MRRFTGLVLIWSFAVAVTVTAQSQTRPRRVNPASPQQDPRSQSQTAPPQTNESAQPPRPGRAPVLGGANRDPNEQKPAAPQKDAAPEEVSEGDVVKVDTTLVSIPVSVMDRDGKFIPNLSQNDFHVWEDGVEQRVAYFASTEKPFTVALLIDTSGSTRFRLEQIQEAAIAFVQQLRADDRVMIVSFSDKIRYLSGREPTNDRNRLYDAIRQTEPGSGTRLYDAVDEMINQHFNQIQGRKAIVLFTDGVDTTSRQGTFESNVRDAEELDALIYPVEYDTFADMGAMGGGWPGGGGGSGSSGSVLIDILAGILGGGNGGGSYPNGGGSNGGPNRRGGRRGGGGGGGWPGTGNSKAEYELGDQYLHELARVSGARLYNAEQQNLALAFRSVAEELRRQYSLGYYPTNAPRAGERRNIKVRVNRPELVVRTRDSYVFQPGANAAAQQTTQPTAPVLKKNFNRGFVR